MQNKNKETKDIVAIPTSATKKRWSKPRIGCPKPDNKPCEKVSIGIPASGWCAKAKDGNNVVKLAATKIFFMLHLLISMHLIKLVAERTEDPII